MISDTSWGPGIVFDCYFLLLCRQQSVDALSGVMQITKTENKGRRTKKSQSSNPLSLSSCSCSSSSSPIYLNPSRTNPIRRQHLLDPRQTTNSIKDSPTYRAYIPKRVYISQPAKSHKTPKRKRKRRKHVDDISLIHAVFVLLLFLRLRRNLRDLF